jgi:predicted GNAT superfamily acetyltransferase
MIRDARESDFGQILALNAESVHFLSPLDHTRLRHLHTQAAYYRVVDDDGTISAFLLAFREGADYDSPNYAWFARTYPQFLYIDRIVVSMIARGRGLGAQLYNDIIAFASESGIDKLTCEFDIDPPNPPSAKFHAYFGFREVGRQHVGDGKKEVSLQVRTV